MKGSLVGESERRLRAALSVVDAVSQGQALFIATCNSIGALPPELRRRFTLGTFLLRPAPRPGAQGDLGHLPQKYALADKPSTVEDKAGRAPNPKPVVRSPGVSRNRSRLPPRSLSRSPERQATRSRNSANKPRAGSSRQAHAACTPTSHRDHRAPISASQQLTRTEEGRIFVRPSPFH